jgi:hypothetical protein
MKADGLRNHAKLRGALRDRVTRPKVGDDCGRPSLLCRLGASVRPIFLATCCTRCRVTPKWRATSAWVLPDLSAVAIASARAARPLVTSRTQQQRMRGGVKGAGESYSDVISRLVKIEAGTRG